MQITRKRLWAWAVAIVIVFFATGMAMATWASRVPAIKASLDIDNTQVGLLLLGTGAASILGLSLAPIILLRVGARVGILAGMLIFSGGVLLVGIGSDLVQSYPLTLGGLILFGLAMGSVDIMMNVEGTDIERRFARTILPLLHAFFSLGTVAGAGLGFLLVGAGVSILPHLTAVTVLLAVIAVTVGFLIPRGSRTEETAPHEEERLPWRQRLRTTLSAWREPRTYALGVVMLGMAFAEGGATDWLPLSMVEGHGSSEQLGAAALTVFSISMTAVRVAGGPLVDRLGRVAVLRVLAALATGGLLLFILAPNVPLAFVGIVLWGMGASLGFPLGMSAAADDPAKAAARVAAASTIGYIAFLCGPPLLGFISSHIGLLNTLFIVVGLVAASGLAAGAARPLAGSPQSQRE